MTTCDTSPRQPRRRRDSAPESMRACASARRRTFAVPIACAAWVLASAIGAPAYAQTPGATKTAGSADAIAATPHAAAAPAGTADIRVRTWTDRTAAWVGDIVTYHVELTLAPNVDVLLDDLSRDKVKANGFDILGTDEAPAAVAPNGTTTRRFTYTMATYDIGTPTLGVPDFTVRYYARRRGQRLEDATPAGQITVPGASVAFRSTLPEDLKEVQARDYAGAETLPSALAFVRPVGLGLLLVSVFPVALWLLSFAAHLKPLVARWSRRTTRTDARSALEELKTADLSTDARLVEAYSRLETIVRGHVAGVTGLAAAALTPQEIGARLENARSRMPAGPVRELLAECEQARYGTARHRPARDRFETALAAAAEVVGHAR